MKSEERPAVVLLALPIRRPLRREPPVLATLHTCARPAAVLGISLRDYRGLSPYLLTGSRCPKSGDELPTHMPEESKICSEKIRNILLKTDRHSHLRNPVMAVSLKLGPKATLLLS